MCTHRQTDILIYRDAPYIVRASEKYGVPFHVSQIFFGGGVDIRAPEWWSETGDPKIGVGGDVRPNRKGVGVDG